MIIWEKSVGQLEHNVRVQVTETEPDGSTRFIDEFIPFTSHSGPLRTTAAMSATAMSFRWTPGAFDFDFHPSPRQRLVLVTEGALEITVGSGEARIFRPGDILSIRDTWGQGHRSRSVNGKPFRSAFIALDNERLLDRREPMENENNGGIEYVHNQERSDGASFFERKTMPYIYGGPEGKETAELSLESYQFVFADGSLDYGWHPAPQRQIVQVLTGGLAMEYGDGAYCDVPPGGFLIGEDTDGQGHITRALRGKARLSVFARLA